ncbi:hypothetical protein GCM10020256_13450 [Streptomyces thermocoprophilus]
MRVRVRAATGPGPGSGPWRGAALCLSTHGADAEWRARGGGEPPMAGRGVPGVPARSVRRKPRVRIYETERRTEDGHPPARPPSHPPNGWRYTSHAPTETGRRRHQGRGELRERPPPARR